MKIVILSFGFGLLEPEDEQYYEDFGRNLHDTDDEGHWLIDHEGEYVSGDSGIALGLCREFRKLGHEAIATHYENVEEACKDADLVLTLGPGAIMEKYQQYGDADSIYWWYTFDTVEAGTLPPEQYVKEHIADAPFDGVLTNGRPVLAPLREACPCRHLHLGYNSERLWGGGADADYNADIVYVGSQYIKSDEQFELLFDPASEYDLAIYGDGWEGSQFEKYYEGLLPRGHLGAVYSNATVVLGLQGEYMDFGMLNDRVFEALATDSIFVDEYHPLLEADPVGEYINTVSSKSEFATMLDEIFAGSTRYRQRAEEGGEHVRNSHTYADKCQEILDFYTAEL